MPKEEGAFDHAANLHGVIADAKKQAFFGLALAGKNSEWPAIETSKTKKPYQLEVAARKRTGSTKVGCGTLNHEGGNLILRFLAAPPANCQGLLKSYFAAFKIGTKIVLILPSGAMMNDVDDDAAKTGQDLGASKDAPGADIEVLRAELKALNPRLVTQIKSDVRLVPTVKKLLVEFTDATGDTPNVARAGLILAALRRLVETPEPSGNESQESESSEPLDQPLRIASDGWVKAITTAGAELDKLHEAIRAAGAGAPGLSKVDKAFTTLRDNLGQMRRALEVPLSDGIGSDQSGPVAKARQDALKLATQVEKILGTHPILSKIDQNPFVPIKASAGLTGAISEMRQALA